MLNAILIRETGIPGDDNCLFYYITRLIKLRISTSEMRKELLELLLSKLFKPHKHKVNTSEWVRIWSFGLIIYLIKNLQSKYAYSLKFFQKKIQKKIMFVTVILKQMIYKTFYIFILLITILCHTLNHMSNLLFLVTLAFLRIVQRLLMDPTSMIWYFNHHNIHFQAMPFLKNLIDAIDENICNEFYNRYTHFKAHKGFKNKFDGLYHVCDRQA